MSRPTPDELAALPDEPIKHGGLDTQVAADIYLLDRQREAYQTLLEWTNLDMRDCIIISRWLVRRHGYDGLLRIGNTTLYPLSPRGRRVKMYLEMMSPIDAWFWICDLDLYKHKHYWP